MNKEDARKVADDLDFTRLGTEIDRRIEAYDNKEEYEAFCEQERIKLITSQI